MVEPQSSKLITRVRFPSSAPLGKGPETQQNEWVSGPFLIPGTPTCVARFPLRTPTSPQHRVPYNPPTYLGDCQKAVEASQDMVAQWLETNMLSGLADKESKSKDIAEWLGTHANSAMHNRHITAGNAEKHGLVIKRLEDDSELQESSRFTTHTWPPLNEAARRK